MKNYYLLLLCLLILGNTKIYASVQDLQKATWIGVTEKPTLTTTDEAVLYEMDKQSSYGYFTGKYINKQISREVLVLDSYKKKKMRKPITVKVVGYHNTAIQFHFDTYIVEYNNQLYFLPKQYAYSNRLLDEKNKELDNDILTLNNKKDSISNEISKLDIETECYRTLTQEKLAHFTKKQDSLLLIIRTAEKQAVPGYQQQVDEKYQKQYDNWYSKLPNSTKTAVKAIKIDNAGLSSPNSEGGCDYYFRYTNTSRKTIKYLNWSGWVYNAVNDMVSCDIRRTSSVSGRDTGPVEYNQSGGGSWSNVIYNYSADCVKLSYISIQYMDGSSYMIKEDDLRKMLNVPKKTTLSYSEKKTITEKAALQQKTELKICKDSLSYWNKKKSVLSSLNSSYVSREIAADSLYKVLSFKRKELVSQNRLIDVEIFNYHKANFLDSTQNTITTKQLTKRVELSKKEAELNKKLYVGTGLDWLMSGDYMGVTIPLEIIFGNPNQRFNFSLAGNYTYLDSYGSIPLKQFGAMATVYLNLIKSKHFCMPLSFGLGYNINLGAESFDVNGYYYDSGKQEFTALVEMNKGNFSSAIALGARWQHWMFSMYVRFDLTPVYDKSKLNAVIPAGETIFYDDYTIENVVGASSSLPLFGMSLRYYF